MINALVLAKLCAAIYSPKNEFSSIIQNDGIYAGMSETDGQTVVAFRGSANVSDWLRDLDALPEYIDGIGIVHAGMFEGIEDFFGKLNLKKGNSCILTGHSLGCAHAAFAAALALRSGVSVRQLELFAPPHCGDAEFHETIGSIPTRSWRNGIDPVTDVPLGPPWEQFALQKIYEPPTGDDSWNIVAWHAISLYVHGMTETI